MSIYSDKLAHVQVVINSPYSVEQMCTREDTLAHNLGAPYIDDVMSYYGKYISKVRIIVSLIG